MKAIKTIDLEKFITNSSNIKEIIDVIEDEIKNNPNTVKPIDSELMTLCYELIKDVNID